MKRNDIINALIAKGYKAEAQNSIKNGVVFEGIVIKGEDPIAPLIYTERLIEDAEAQGKSLADVVANVINVYESNRNVEFNLEDLMTRTFVLNHIYLGIQKESDENLEKKSSNLEGIEQYMYIRGEMLGEEYFIKINEGFLQKAGVNSQEAWAKAEENTFSETVIENIAAVLAEICGLEYEEDIHLARPMYVISNGCRVRGASAILNRSALEMFGKEHDIKNIIVLPSSIHEMLIMPDDGTLDIDEMSEMVKDINMVNVAPEERLTNRAYRMAL